MFIVEGPFKTQLYWTDDTKLSYLSRLHKVNITFRCVQAVPEKNELWVERPCLKRTHQVDGAHLAFIDFWL